jgi:uncharacterized repeat protein (TIGR03803 family)
MAVATLALASVEVPVAEPATTYTVLHILGNNSGDPAFPYLDVFAQARDGNLYTTSSGGGANNQGTVFQLTPGGQVTVLHSFHVSDGAVPYGGLTLGTDGSLYGTTTSGGAAGQGTIFRITTDGAFTVLRDLSATAQEGCCPMAPPIQGPDGNFYGTTGNGNGAIPNFTGTVYKLTPSGTFTALYRFDDPTDGGNLALPAALTLGADGNFYGTTLGRHGPYGAVYRITPEGALTVLHTFNGTDGAKPYGPLIQGSDGNFYGTTRRGGTSNVGTIYRMTPAGVVTDIFSFAGSYYAPLAGLVQATDGNFYGGAFGTRGGTLFQLTAAGSLSNVHPFQVTDGIAPYNTLIQHTNGSLYGATYEGGLLANGAYAQGVVYRLNVGLGPFVRFLPAQSPASVGSTIQVLGQGFTQATAVRFGGVAASFHVVSDTYLTAVVPSGATTGPLTVTVGGSNLSSNQVFRISP